MKYLILVLFIIFMSGCTRHYTNEECVKKIEQMAGDYYSGLDREDRSLFEIGASIDCAKYHNDPYETNKNVSKDNP